MCDAVDLKRAATRFDVAVLLAQIFAAEMKGPRDRPQERPRGAFGQEYPQVVSSSASSAAVSGPLKVCS